MSRGHGTRSTDMSQAFKLNRVIVSFNDFQLGPLELELEPGTALGLIGPNGSGKTTTMHCLTGLREPDSGEITVFGHRVDPYRPRWKREIGYVGDVQTFYERWTGEQNLLFQSQFYPSWSQSKANQLARRFQLPLNKRANQLSTGNRVKLSLVAVLARSPRLLLLDEPISGIDPVVRAEVLDVLFETLESGENAMLYATHVLSDINRLVDELAFVDAGQVVLRTGKDSLTESWRRISFRMPEPEQDIEFRAVVSVARQGMDCQVISSDYPTTLAQLSELGAERVRDNRLPLEEIAVEIMRGGKNPAPAGAEDS